VSELGGFFNSLIPPAIPYSVPGSETAHVRRKRTGDLFQLRVADSGPKNDQGSEKIKPNRHQGFDAKSDEQQASPTNNSGEPGLFVYIVSRVEISMNWAIQAAAKI